VVTTCTIYSGSDYFATDGQSASLFWCRAPIWIPWPDFYYCRTFAVFMLWRPPWREDGSVIYSYNLLSLSGPTRDIVRSHMSLSQLWGPGPCIYIPRNRVAQLYPRALGSLFVASYDSQGYGGGILHLFWKFFTRIYIFRVALGINTVYFHKQLVFVIEIRCFLWCSN
jgi:hypothetical protein